ncbi:hypothetical protein PGT21_014681 [Puccinia graminis f. sp. tritici]|uniref:Uncharacterized protein n=1 Tax=Puccinia graminis f. sp. tritici TaxID=56615 RepID=A0A5B0NVD2_PUCGR|nr:hypothetical protein PGT21_014681 [Puccinia graminis f. sp. tritici]KAA1093257.1 hypothetical protein PGTUg99_004092 [Puccinia graminis f. sp. tritici]
MHGLEEETVVTMIKNTIPLSRPIRNNNRPTGLKFNLPFSSKKGLWLDVLAQRFQESQGDVAGWTSAIIGMYQSRAKRNLLNAGGMC